MDKPLVVNSMLLTELGLFQSCVSLDGCPIRHLTPNGKEAALYSAEEVYEMLPANLSFKKKNVAAKGRAEKNGYGAGQTDGQLDDHSLWGEVGGQERKRRREEWEQRLVQAALTVEIQQSSNGCDNMPSLAERLLGALRRPQTDWRALLRNFLQQEIYDYGFTPPDRRFQDSPFILPDWSETREIPGKLWFFVDCSGSISDEAMTSAFTEINGALDEFSSLDAVLSFFDAAVTEPVPFSNVSELLRLRPRGGGGTSFLSIFHCLKEFLTQVQPTCLIIMTDGYADFPEESAALRLPVLWLINNEKVTPPWGLIARWKV